MTDFEIQCLKDNVDRAVEIETSEGERLIANVKSVIYDKEYDEHELIYQVVSSNTPAFYSQRENSGGFVLGFEKILSVKARSDFGSPKP
jgi:hypothetical protein